MVSRAAVKALIDETEAKYRECWETLTRMKESFTPVKTWEGSEAKDLLEAILNFQPTLGFALLELSKMYRELHQEKYKIIAKKGTLSPDWFRHRLALIGRYQEHLKTTISIGKCLGDSFAWFFYQNERHRLPQHYDIQNQLQAPGHVGGTGEIEFVRRLQMRKGHLLIHHGLTTFLRLGDVSFIDLESLKLTAVAELKTRQVADKELAISVTLIGEREEGALPREAALLLEDFKVDLTVRDDRPTPPPLSQSARARFERQVAALGESLLHPEPQIGQELIGCSNVTELEALWGELKTSTSAHRRVGDGQILTGFKIRKRTLSSKLMMGFKYNFSKQFPTIEEQARRTIIEGSSDNTFWVNGFHGPTPEYCLAPGMTPLLWWPVDPELVRAIFFCDVLLFSVYNPAHLLSKLRMAGFNVERTKGQQGLRIEKISGDKSTTLEGFGHFVNYVVKQLFSEEDVLKMISSTSRKIESEEVPPNTKVVMQVEQHFV